MMDWKMLAASLVALVFVASLLVGDFAVKGLFSGVGDKLSEWFAPLSGLLTAPSGQAAKADTIEITMRPEKFTMKPDGPVNVSFSWGDMDGFSGEIRLDYEADVMLLDESDTRMAMTVPIQNAEIRGLTFKKLTIRDTVMTVKADKWEISSGNGSIEVSGFSGTGYVTADTVMLIGNITGYSRF
jgi:hypothetical protein